MEKDIQLGQKVQDEISGFTGIVTTIGDHITGCTRFGVRPTGEEQTSRRGNEEFFYGEQLTVVEENTEWIEHGDRALTETEFELGERVRDTVTETEGIVLVINYMLFNCPKIAYQPAKLTDVESADVEWIDAPRLETIDEGVKTEFSDVQETDSEEATGSVADSPEFCIDKCSDTYN